jgi:hypothetical protein
MRTKSPAEVMAIASAKNASRLTQEAIIEAPQILTGLPPEHVEQLRNAVVERTNGPQLDKLREESAALDFAAAVLDDARGALSDAAGFPRVQHGAALSPGFAKWFAEAAGASDDKSEAAEFARNAAAGLLENAKSLAFDYDALKALSAGVSDLQVAALKAS